MYITARDKYMGLVYWFHAYLKLKSVDFKKTLTSFNSKVETPLKSPIRKYYFQNIKCKPKFR